MGFRQLALGFIFLSRSLSHTGNESRVSGTKIFLLLIVSGYAPLTSDEGQRILSSINGRQGRHEPDRGLLNNMRTGVGDCTTLLEGDRGFKQTSFSIAALIQPSPLVHELASMNMKDGFFDRLLQTWEYVKLYYNNN